MKSQVELILVESKGEEELVERRRGEGVTRRGIPCTSRAWALGRVEVEDEMVYRKYVRTARRSVRFA